jgi:predicted membrane channel-forming protein YqfA (hemolysin III family)
MCKWIFGHFVAGAILALVDYVLPEHGFNYLAVYLFLVLGLLIVFLFFGLVEIILSNEGLNYPQGKNVNLWVQKNPHRIVMRTRQPR